MAERRAGLALVAVLIAVPGAMLLTLLALLAGSTLGLAVTLYAAGGAVFLVTLPGAVLAESAPARRLVRAARARRRRRAGHA